MGLKVFILTYLFAVCGTHAFHTVFPEGKEVVYEYIGTISTSPLMTKLYVSSFTLVGNLHLQTDNHTVFAKFSDLKYEIYNGIEDQYDSKPLPIPEEMSDFSKTFRIEYLPTGNIAGIATGKDEKQYVVNFKKAISSMLQLDMQMMKKHEGHKAYAFRTDENTMYGKGKVYYNVKTDKDSCHIDIMQEPRSTRHMYTHMLTNVDYQFHGDFDEPLSRDSQRNCVLKHVGDDKIIDFIEHNGGIYYTPFNGQGEAHTLNINQSLVLTTTTSISSKMEMESEIYHDDLTYHVADLDSVDSTYPDFTNGRRKMPMEVMVGKAIDLIKEIVDFMAEYKIEDKMIDLKKSQLLGKLSHVMLFLDENMLNDMYDKLSNEVHNSKRQYLQFYLQMLPQTGTHAAYHVMIKLITSAKIDDSSLLHNMFDNVKFPNKKLVDDMAAMLKWDSDDYPQRIYESAILSFGTLLNKAVDRNHKYTHANHKFGFNANNKLEEEFPDHKYYEKYVIELVSKLKEAKRYSLKILFMQALYNTKMESIVQHLLPAVRGDWWEDYHLRMLAAKSISPLVTKDEELTFEIYWPLMTNSDLPTSFRIICYYMIMKSQPSLPRILNMYWAMESMKDHELYMFHYKYITAHSQSETPHNHKFIVHLKQILKYTYKPVFMGLTDYHHLDYFNELYSIGEELDLVTIHSKDENDLVIGGSYQYNVNRLSAAPYWIFMRISGFHPSFLKELKVDTTSKKVLFTWDNLLNSVISLGKDHDAKFTLIIASNGHVISSIYYDKNDMVALMELVKDIGQTLKIGKQSIDVSHELSKTLIMPTDMGFPAIFFNYVPDIDYSDIAIYKSFKDTEMKFTFDIKFKSLTNARRGLAFYNPFLDVFQGVSKIHSMDYEINFRVNASIDVPNRGMMVSWKKVKDIPNEDMFAERNYAATMVYVIDDFKTGALQKSSSKCNNFEFIDLGEEYKMNKTTLAIPLFDIGSDFIEYVFEQEEQLPKELDSEVEYDAGGIKETLKSIMYSLRFEELQPEDISYGLTRTLKHNSIYPIDNMLFVITFNTEYKKGNNYLYPAVTHSMNLQYDAGTDTDPFTSWIVNAMVDMDDGHMNNSFVMHVTKTLGDAKVKVCVEGDSVWSDNDMKSTVYFSTNLLEDKTCSKKDALLTLKMIGEKSEEQLTNMYSYDSCLDDRVGGINKQKTHDCVLEYDTLRKYTIDIMHGFGEEKKKKYHMKLNDVTSKIFTDSDSIKPLEEIKSNEIRMVFDIPMRPAAPLKMQIYTEDSGTEHHISESMENEGLHTVYGSMFEFLHEFGLTDVCVVDNIIRRHSNKVDHIVSKDWTLYLGTTKTEPKFELWMKSTDGNHMMFKFIFKTHTFIVEQKDGNYKLTVDGKEMDADKFVYTCDWLHYAVVKDTNIISVYVRNIGIHVIYNGYQVSIEYPQIEGVDMKGHCLEEHASA